MTAPPREAPTTNPPPARRTVAATGAADGARSLPPVAHAAPDASPIPPRRFTPAERERAILAVMPRVRSAVLRLAGKHADRHQIDDLLGVALLGACELARKFDPDGPAKFETYVTGWLNKRVAGERVEGVRHAGRFPNPLLDHGRTSADTVGVADLEPGEPGESWQGYWDAAFGVRGGGPTAADGEMLALLKGPTLRRVVELTVFEGLSAGQIAAQLGQRLTTVRMLQRQAGRVLMKAAGKGDGGPVVAAG